MSDNLIYVAKITKPHGIRGQARLISFTSNPGDVFNYPQGRVTDHRINLTLYKIAEITDGGDLNEMISALATEDEARRLSQNSM